MHPNAANSADDLAGRMNDVADAADVEEICLSVNGKELSSDGLDELAALLLGFGRPEKPKKRRSGSRQT